MTKAIISSVIDLTEGGCNACGVVKCVSYTLSIDDRDIPLEELTVSSLVMTIVLKNGFKQEMKMDVLDDYLSFTKAGYEVQLFEEYDLLTYKSLDGELQTKDRIEDTRELTEKVNELLTTLFKIEAIDFEVE
ncbi:DUF4809 family protein [Candidatus Enterococcus clewellii]|uniref:DUF4809 domain-containing protein n=1 Tax=Candidatus Enterococcus clewellii TaxID=1834193 RepID=A0A242JYM8_9ENTE|nr:DUF4809 family protein [Enterococcus sp. 9E7_DIV0242]OTP09803.1 hypothetical protein A5888_003999 [Enterococcus sp. 9E7_DIV0242]